MLDLNYTSDQIDVTDINRTFHATTAEHPFLNTHRTSSRVDAEATKPVLPNLRRLKSYQV